MDISRWTYLWILLYYIIFNVYDFAETFFFLLCRVTVNIQKISADVWVVGVQYRVPFFKIFLYVKTNFLQTQLSFLKFCRLQLTAVYSGICRWAFFVSMFRQRPYFHFYHSRFDKYKNVEQFWLSVDLLQFGKNKILLDIFFIPIGVGLSDCFNCVPFWSTNRVLMCAVVLTVQNFSCLPTFSQTSFESIGFLGTH